MRTLEEEIILLKKEATKEAISVREIMGLLPNKGRPLFLILLSAPFCQPIQIPGFSTPFGLVIAFLGLCMAAETHFWLPERILVKEISSDTLIKICNGALIVLNKLKRWIHPRLIWVCQLRLNGLLIFCSGLFLALPLPIPFTNLTAGWAILLTAIGMLEDDGLLVFFGYLIALATTFVLLFMGEILLRYL